MDYFSETYSVIRSFSLGLLPIICLSFLLTAGCTLHEANNNALANSDNGSIGIQSEEQLANISKNFNQGEGKIVFISYIDEKPEIYLMDGYGRNRERLTENDIYEFSPDWSPNGNQIVFISRTDGSTSLDLMDLDTRLTTHLIEGNEFLDNPIWSPTGEWIALGKSGELFLISPDLNYEVQLTDFDGGIWSAPLAWSADGERILFHSNYEIPGPVVSAAKLYTLNIKDKEIQEISDRQFSYLQNADWTPNEQRIVFTEGLRGTRLFVWNYQDKIDPWLGETKRPESPPYDWIEVDGKWLPDGQRIIFSMSKYEGNLDIFILDTLNGDLIRLTDDFTHEKQPDWWSP